MYVDSNLVSNNVNFFPICIEITYFLSKLAHCVKCLYALNLLKKSLNKAFSFELKERKEMFLFARQSTRCFVEAPVTVV